MDIDETREIHAAVNAIADELTESWSRFEASQARTAEAMEKIILMFGQELKVIRADIAALKKEAHGNT